MPVPSSTQDSGNQNPALHKEHSVITKERLASSTHSPIKVTSNLAMIGNSSFEQRAKNKVDAVKNYFNQPVQHYPITFPVTASQLEKVQHIINNMRTNMKNCGIGLAHNQQPKTDTATHPYALFIIELDGENMPAENVPFEAFINPVIVGYSDETEGFYHGCLSAKDTNRAQVATYKEILIAFYSDKLQLKVKKYTGMAAIICQHEFNHLATSGTYVDAVNYYYTGDRYQSAKDAYLSQEALDESGKGSEITHNPSGLPCLTSKRSLAQCKQYLNDNKHYKEAVDRYLQDHPKDKPLHHNLNSISLHPIQKTYYEPCYPSTVDLKHATNLTL